MRRPAPFAALVLLVAAVPAARAAGGAGADILRAPVSARFAALADASTALGEGLPSFHGNPAGLALAQRPQAGTFHREGLAGAAADVVAVLVPLPTISTAVLGTSLLWSRLGQVDVLSTNPDGSFRDERRISAGSDLLVSLAAAYSIPRQEGPYFNLDLFPNGPDHHVGVTARLLRSTLTEQYTAHTLCVDAGYLAVMPSSGTRIGLSVQNMGSGLKYKKELDSLPLVYRFGVAWPRVLPRLLPSPPSLSLEAAADSEKTVFARFGLEWKMGRALTYRAGYERTKKENRWSAGIGLNIPAPWSGPMQMDYAIAPIGSLGFTHLLSVTCEFATPPHRASRKETEKAVPARKFL